MDKARITTLIENTNGDQKDLKNEHGLSILIEVDKKKVLVDSIIERTGLKLYGILGGTHLVKEDDDKINEIIDYLKGKDIKLIGACHCTGKQGQTMFSQQLEEEFIDNHTGYILETKNPS